MPTSEDDILSKRADEVRGNLEAMMLQELKIIAILLRQGFNIPDEDQSLLRQENPVLQKSNYPT